MKRLYNSKYFQISCYTLAVVILSIFCFKLFSRTDSILPTINSGVSAVIAVINPILYGLLIAYLFNPIVDLIEKVLLKWTKSRTKKALKWIRNLSILLMYVGLIGIVCLMCVYLVPQLASNFKTLYTQIPEYVDKAQGFLTGIQGVLESDQFYVLELPNLEDVINGYAMPQLTVINELINSFFSHTMTFFTHVFNWFMGFVIAFYILAQKEDLSKAMTRITHALLPTTKATKVITIAQDAHDTFISFFVGKFIDSLIIGILAFIGLYCLKNPYALLLAFIIGVLNMIPYFGPIIGAIPAIVITLFEGFVPALIVGLFVLALQQFDGLVLGPKILGGSIGLTPFWIISGILVGGALWGPLGMFFASPLLAVSLRHFNNYIDYRLMLKNNTTPK